MKEFKLDEVAAHQKHRFKEFISGIKNSGASNLHYLHLSFPHHTWINLPEGTTYNSAQHIGTKKGLHVWSDQQVLVFGKSSTEAISRRAEEVFSSAELLDHLRRRIPAGI